MFIFLCLWNRKQIKGWSFNIQKSSTENISLFRPIFSRETSAIISVLVSQVRILHIAAASVSNVCLSVSLYVPVRRPCRLPKNYTELGDERLTETDYTELVYEKTSPYQVIRILQSRVYGRVLTLDDDVSKCFCWRLLTVDFTSSRLSSRFVHL